MPLNDVGSNFWPYDATSSFALEPMHLSLESLAGASLSVSAVAGLRARFPLGGKRFFDTGIKAAKLELLRQAFGGRKNDQEAFVVFKAKNTSWLEPYVQYKALKARFGDAAWEKWPDPLRDRHSDALTCLTREVSEDLEFERWLQWQAALQLETARREVNRQGILLMGDLPFLVSRDSADVWAERPLFKLGRVSGAPPDLYFADGQAWGMPPHDWPEQERTGFAYLKHKIAYASHFYDAFRIDHFVGLFRVWTFERSADGTVCKETGVFDPPDELLWEPQGRKILQTILETADLLPCAEDLGVVPSCSDRVLHEHGIPGMEIQRWMRRWDTDKEWKKPEEYRPNAIAMVSTHDMVPLELWWRNEMKDPEERDRFLRLIDIPSDSASPDFLKACLRASLAAASVFSIQLFQDWFCLEAPDTMRDDERLNFPGLIKDTNWRYLSRYSIEQMEQLACNPLIKSLLIENNRVTTY